VIQEDRKSFKFIKFIKLFIVSIFQKEYMYLTLHSDINSLKCGLLHLTGRPNLQRGRAKDGDGFISRTIFLATISDYQCNM